MANKKYNNMSMMNPTAALAAANKRKEEALADTIIDNLQGKSKKTTKVKMNIMLYPEHKKRLQEYAESKHVSASQIIQGWVDRFCV